MRKNVRMRLMEAETGQDVRKIIAETVERCGTLLAAAEELGMSISNLAFWIKELDGHTETTTTTRVWFDGYEIETREVAAVA